MSTHTETKKWPQLLILLATVIWGGSFVVMKDALDSMTTFWLLAVRFLGAGAILALVFCKRWKYCDKGHLIGGTVMGACCFLAYAFQTMGLNLTTPGKNAFLTAVYCVVVPFLYWLIAKKRPDRYNIMAAVLSVIGIGLVSLSGDLSVNLGDMLTLIGGFFFAAHIVAVAHYAEGRDIFILTTLQFLSFGILALVTAVVVEGPLVMVYSESLLFGLGYLIILASCGALLFQNIGQKYTPPATAAVLLCLEAPFGVIFSMLVTQERPTVSMFIGFGLIFLAIICSETKFSFLKSSHQGKSAS